MNYVRAERPSPGFVMSLSSGEAWADTKYMKPVLQDDPLLMFNFEDEMESPCEEEEEENGLEIDISRELNDEIANPKNVFNSIDVINVSAVIFVVSPNSNIAFILTSKCERFDKH